MYALITDGSISKYLNGNRGITIGGIQYPQNIFTVWTAAEKEAIGIYEVIQDNTNKKDEEYYINTNASYSIAQYTQAEVDADVNADGIRINSFSVGDNKVVRSYGSATAKAHADTKWTQAQIDDPSLVGTAPEGADTNTVRLVGLKTVKIRTVKSQAAGILRDTDWYIVRKADAGTAVPSAITTHRAAVRTKCAAMETAITNASDTPAIETLYTYTEQEDGSVTRPLGELPTLES